MKKSTIIKLLFLAVISLSACGQKKQKLKPTSWISIDIPEPSDICINANNDNFFIVSDNGILFETDRNGKIKRSIDQAGTDFEAVFSDANYIYCVDESNRDIYQYEIKDFKYIKTINKPFSGARNKGYESMTYNAISQHYLLIIERDPITLFELDQNFATIKQVDLSNIAKDISSAKFYNNALWLLSDEDAVIVKLDPKNYQILDKWKIPVLNPEGIAFDKNGKILITSDDMQRIYYFDNPEKN